MTDRELLARAAKAGAIFLTPEQFAKESSSPWLPEMAPRYDERANCLWGYRTFYGKDGEIGGWEVFAWAPLTDDGDALRLAVALNIQSCNFAALRCATASVLVQSPRDLIRIEVNHFETNGDPYAATRRAIVRAAASIG